MKDQFIENLRYAIVRQAALDYANALRFLNKPPISNNQRLLENKRLDMELVKKDCENFFRSHEFSNICSLDGEKIIEEIRRKSGLGTFGKFKSL